MRDTLGHQRDRHSQVVFVNHTQVRDGEQDLGREELPAGWQMPCFRVASGSRTQTFEVAFEGASDGTPVTSKGATVGLLGDPKK